MRNLRHTKPLQRNKRFGAPSHSSLQNTKPSLLRTYGLSETDATAAIESDAFGPLAAELRRAEANHHNVDALLPRLVQARGFDDADDIAALLRHRVEAARSLTAGSGRSRETPRLIAGRAT